MTARHVVEARVCEACGGWFERRRFPSGQLEGLAQFADRRFCSRPCFRKAAADGLRVRPPGAWFIEPYGLNGDSGASPETQAASVTGGRYPWDSGQTTPPHPLPGHFQPTPTVPDSGGRS